MNDKNKEKRAGHPKGEKRELLNKDVSDCHPVLLREEAPGLQ